MVSGSMPVSMPAWVRMKSVSGVFADQRQPVLHLGGEKLQVEGQAVVLQPRHIGLRTLGSMT